MWLGVVFSVLRLKNEKAVQFPTYVEFSKNCYTNPFNKSICISTALGCYFSVQEEVWDAERETTFRCKGAKTETGVYQFKI